MKATMTLIGTMLLSAPGMTPAADLISQSWQRNFQPLTHVLPRPPKARPTAPVIAAQLPPPPPVVTKAEPAIKYLGQMQRDGQTFIFAELDGRVYSALKGEVIGKQYRLVDANDREAWVTRLSSNETVVLSLR